MPSSEYARSQCEGEDHELISDEEGFPPEQVNEEIPSNSSPKPRFKSPSEVSHDKIKRDSFSGSRERSASFYHAQNGQFIAHVNLIMDKVKSLEADVDWGKVFRHRSGVEVFAQKDASVVGKDRGVSVLKGVGLIKGHSPASVFPVIVSSRLWDEWYEDGFPVENLSDQISLTYMCMKAALGTRVRDLSLVEKVEVLEDGTIYFVASSVTTQRVPAVPGRVRAHIDLTGWVLEPINFPTTGPSGESPQVVTKVTYYLQVNVRTFVPEAISKRYLSRRPLLCITRIDSYLQKHGSPVQAEAAGSNETPHSGTRKQTPYRGFLRNRPLDLPKENYESISSAHPSSTGLSHSLRGKRYLSSLGLSSLKISPPRLPTSPSVPSLSHLAQQPDGAARARTVAHKITFHGPIKDLSCFPIRPVDSDVRPRDDDQILMAEHLRPNRHAPGFQALQHSLELFEMYAKEPVDTLAGWKVMINSKNATKFWLNHDVAQELEKETEAYLCHLPLVKSDAIVDSQPNSCFPPVTKAQVLMTILSNLAQGVWDAQFRGYSQINPNSYVYQSLLTSSNGFDQGTYLMTMKSVYPHLPNESVFCFDQMVVRTADDQGEDDMDAKITVVHHSVDDEPELLRRLEKNTPEAGIETALRKKLEAKLLSRINFGGWLIQTGVSADEIRVTHLSALKINLSKKNQLSPGPTKTAANIQPFVSKLIVSHLANRPQHLSDFIKLYGFCPGFVRWGAGAVEYLGDFELNPDESSLQSQEGIQQGRIEWRFMSKRPPTPQNQVGESPTMANQTSLDQVCWFQWSDKMYSEGIELKLEPPNAAQVRIVKKMQNTLQFDWTPPITADTVSREMIKLQAKPILKANHPLETGETAGTGVVKLNGQLLSQAVSPRVKPRPRKHKKPAALPSYAQSHSSTLNDSGVGLGSSNGNATLHDEELIYPAVGKGPLSIGTSAASTSPKQSQQPSPSVSMLEPFRKSKSHESPHEKLANVKGEPPPDHNLMVVQPNVMLIINRDLYFTKSQVLFLIACVGLSYLYGRFG